MRWHDVWLKIAVSHTNTQMATLPQTRAWRTDGRRWWEKTHQPRPVSKHECPRKQEMTPVEPWSVTFRVSRVFKNKCQIIKRHQIDGCYRTTGNICTIFSESPLKIMKGFLKRLIISRQLQNILASWGANEGWGTHEVSPWYRIS